MRLPPLSQPVAHSVGLNRPARPLPALACDAHMHIFAPEFAPSPHWKRTPPEARVGDYRQLQQRLGTARTVVVTPSTYGTDNACTLDALRQLGDSARGVAVVDQDVSDAELSRLDAQGVRGLRVNFVSPQSWGQTTQEMLVTLAHKLAGSAWHLQLFAHPVQIVAQADKQVALDPLHNGLATVFPLQDTTSVGQAEGRFVTGIDLVLIVVAKVRTAGAPGAFVERQANLFVDADFRLEIRVTHQIASTEVHLYRTATLPTAVQQVVGVGLVKIRGFIGTGNTALDAQFIGDLMRRVEARAPVAAKLAVMIESKPRRDDGFGTDFDVVFSV